MSHASNAASATLLKLRSGSSGKPPYQLVDELVLALRLAEVQDSRQDLFVVAEEVEDWLVSYDTDDAVLRGAVMPHAEYLNGFGREYGRTPRPDSVTDPRPMLNRCLNGA